MSDITALFLSIKENIKRIEGGDRGSGLLNDLRADFYELMELIKLFLISERDSYYGFFLINMQFAANMRSDSIAGIKLNTFPPVFEANPLLLCKFTLKEIIYITCHEIDHVLFNHPAEMLKANPEGDPNRFYRFNLAADAAVNDMLNHEIAAEDHGFMAQPDGVITSRVLSKMFSLGRIREMENYAYYFALIEEKAEQDGQGSAQQPDGRQSMMDRQNQKDGIGSSASGGKDDEQQSGDTQNSDGAQPGEADGEGENGGIVTAADCADGMTDHNWEAGADEEDAAALVREFVNSVVETMNEETRGLMPGSFTSEIEKLNKPPVISWKTVLKKYVGTITANKRKTRTRLNRRQPERFDISGSMDDKVLKIVVAIDTSGSMSNGMIARILNEIFAILAKRKHDITVIECDSDVRKVYKAKTPADVQNKVSGRGGTCFTPVIEYVNKDRYFRDALLIFFTDGFGEREIPRPMTYRNMWVVIGDARHLSVKEPYGTVLSMGED